MTQIEYATASKALSWARISRVGAVVCAVSTMVIGVAILLLYWATYAEVLALIGFLWLFVGAFNVVAGFVCLATAGMLERRHARDRGIEPRPTRILGTVMLLVSTIPVGIACAFFGWHLAFRTVIDVKNLSGAALDAVDIRMSDGHDVKLGPLATGQQARFSTADGGDMSFRVEVQQGATRKELHSVYISGSGLHDRILVDPGLHSRIEHLK